MIVIGLDPGPKESAYVVWDGKTILEHKTLSNETILFEFLPLWRSPLAIEWIEGYGKIVGNEIFDTCRWVGRFEQAAMNSGGGVHLIARKEIKAHLCGSQHANDSHIRQTLIDRIGPIGIKKNPGPTYGIVGHEWSALSVAVTYWNLNMKKEQR